MDHALDERLSVVRELLEDSSLSVAISKPLTEYFELLSTLNRYYSMVLLWDNPKWFNTLSTDLDEKWGILRLAILENDARAALFWLSESTETVRSALRAFLTSEDSQNKSAGLVDIRGLQEVLSEVTRLNERATFLSSVREFQSDAANAVAETLADAQNSAAVAREAAGLAGDAALYSYFEDFSDKELRSATRFRWATIGAISAAVVIGAALPHGTASDWTSLAYRLIVVAGVGGLAAYLGRQASLHRRAYLWAKSISVQLQSFPAFAASLPESETTGAVFQSFALRILGAPPASGEPLKRGAETSDTLTYNQLIELVTAWFKKA
jgi:hypothetical protein